MEKEEIKTLLVDDEYAPVITESEALELKAILGAFVGAYVKNSKKNVKEWLPQKIKESLPETSDDQINEYINDIEVAIKANEQSKGFLAEAKKNGRSRESWLTEQIEKSTSGMSQGQSTQYLQGIDEALIKSNNANLKTLTTKAGAMNQNPHLDGYIAERYHVETFNLNAEASGSPYRAEVLLPKPGEHYQKNSVDIVIKDTRTGKTVSRYQVKYYKDAAKTEQSFKKGDYRGQQKLVPEDQLEAINNDGVKATDIIEAPDGTKSTPLSKTDAKDLQEKAQNGEIQNFDWSNFSNKDLAKQIGIQAGFAGLQGAAIGIGFDLAHKIYSKEEIKAEEIIENALETGVDFGLKSAVGSAIKVGAEKGFIKMIPKGTPAGVCATIGFVGIENAKVLTKVASGDLTPREGVGKMADVSASTIGGLVSMGVGSAWGAKGGTLLGTAIGAFLGGPAGAVLGAKIGSAVGGFVAGTVAYMAGSKTGQAVCSAAKKVVSVAVNVVKDEAKKIVTWGKKVFENAKTTVNNLKQKLSTAQVQ